MMNHAERGIKPFLALLVGVLAVSSGALFARMAQAPALVIAAYRVGLAALVLVPVAFLQDPRWATKRTLKEWAWGILAGFFLAAHFAAWITSLFYTSVANSVVLVNTNPLWVGLFSILVSKTPCPKQTRWAIVCSLCGVFIIGAGDYALHSSALWGDFLALVGSWCAAGYLLVGSKLREKMSLMPYVAICYGSAAIMLWCVVVMGGLPITGYALSTWKAFVGLALVSQLVGHTSYNWALKWFRAEMIAVSLLGEPIIATLGAFLLFSEPIGMLKITGGGLILFSIYLAARGESVPA